MIPFSRYGSFNNLLIKLINLIYMACSTSNSIGLGFGFLSMFQCRVIGHILENENFPVIVKTAKCDNSRTPN